MHSRDAFASLDEFHYHIAFDSLVRLAFDCQASGHSSSDEHDDFETRPTRNVSLSWSLDTSALYCDLLCRQIKPLGKIIDDIHRWIMVPFEGTFECIQLEIHSDNQTTQQGFHIGSYLFLIEFDSDTFLVGDRHSYSFMVIELIRGIRIHVQAMHRSNRTRPVVLLNADRRIENEPRKTKANGPW